MEKKSYLMVLVYLSNILPMKAMEDNSYKKHHRPHQPN